MLQKIPLRLTCIVIVSGVSHIEIRYHRQQKRSKTEYFVLGAGHMQWKIIGKIDLENSKVENTSKFIVYNVSDI